jgi:hypothetical protein
MNNLSDDRTIVIKGKFSACRIREAPTEERPIYRPLLGYVTRRTRDWADGGRARCPNRNRVFSRSGNHIVEVVLGKTEMRGATFGLAVREGFEPSVGL